MKKSNEQFIDSMRTMHPDIVLLGIYTKSNSKVKCKCLIDEHEWDGLPSNLLKGIGCPMCGGKVGSSAENMSRLLSDMGFNIVSLANSIVVSKESSKFLCLDCGNTWDDKFRNFKRRDYGCPKCRSIDRYEAARKKMISEISNLPYIQTTEEYKSALNCIGSNLLPIEEFVSISFPILHTCKLHGIITSKAPRLALAGEGCLSCGVEKTSNYRRKSMEEYKLEVATLNPHIDVLENYKSIHTPILHRCGECGYEWKGMPSNFLRRGGCPHCSITLGERSIEKTLQSLGVTYIFQYSVSKCKFKRVLFFDFYLPEFNMVIEYQGQQHYYPVTFGGLKDTQADYRFSETILRDNTKKEFCKNEGIRLLEIPYWEFENIGEILSNELQIAS